MLNVYNYHNEPKSLIAPPEQMVKQWAEDRKEELKHLTNDLYALQDDYNVGLASNTKPNGEIWWAAKWGRDSTIEFYIPPDMLVVHEVDRAGNITTTHTDIHDIVNTIADALHIDGAFNRDDEYDDEYEEEYEDEDEYDD
jgi:hypothetical protein